MRRHGLIFGLESTDWILVFLVPFVAFWTARLALARGRSPWIWGGAALVLGIPWPGINLPILGVVPVLFLMFFVRPTAQRSNEPRNACSRCASPHSPGQNFCTKCGWDLSHEYTPESSDTVLASEMHQSQTTSTSTLERPSETAAPEHANGNGFAPERPEVAAQDADIPAEHAEQAISEDPAAGDEVGSAPEEAAPATASGGQPEADTRPWGFPVPGPAPTAAGMTARGTALLSEGKLQEAIDQFTKAIALDPRHREALERRAEAYSKQGRQDRADEDYQQVQALNTGS